MIDSGVLATVLEFGWPCRSDRRGASLRWKCLDNVLVNGGLVTYGYYL